MQVGAEGGEKGEFSEVPLVICIKGTPLCEICAVEPSEIPEQVLINDIVAKFHIFELVELEFKDHPRLSFAIRNQVGLTKIAAILW